MESKKVEIKSLVDSEIEEHSHTLCSDETNELRTKDLEIARDLELYRSVCRLRVITIETQLRRLRNQFIMLPSPFDPACAIKQMEAQRTSTIKSYEDLLEVAGNIMSGFGDMTDRAD
jgi:hypothetical protein